MNDIVFEGVIKLPPITKKNSQQIRFNKKTGARWISQSKAYEQYAEKAGWFLKSNAPIDFPVNVQMIFYMPTRRRVDLSNLQSACLDILVDNHILEDDNCRIVVSHDGSKVEYDKENPRTEIKIKRKEERTVEQIN